MKRIVTLLLTIILILPISVNSFAADSLVINIKNGDTISGIFKGWYLCEFSSRAFRKGLMTKAGFFLVLILAFQIDVLMGNSEPVVRTAVTTAYIVVEATSLIENLAQLGVPIPSFLTDKLGALTQKTK